jgi:NAD(P)H-nitrite reductase large subunit
VNWKDAPVAKTICRCKNVTKKDIIHAINRGARSLDDMREMTGACMNSHERDPACMNCSEDVEEMIRYYGALADALRR